MTEKQKPSHNNHLDKDEKPIPLYKKTTDEEQKRGFRISFPIFIGGFALIVLLVTVTPLYSILMRVTPNSWQEAILKPLFRSIPLGSQPQRYSEPIKMPIPKDGTLPVLSFDTRICFSFYSTIENPDPNYISLGQMQAAKKGEIIAEIIAVGAQDKYQYRIEDTYYTEAIDKNNKIISVICQRFGRAYGTMPESIEALYIRPIKPFMANKTVWNSIKHLYDDYSSPLEPNGVTTP
jgi:hypothetical protein